METIRSRGQALESLQNSIIFRSTPSDNGRLLKLAIDFFWTGSAVTTRFFDMIENTMEKAFYTVQKKKQKKNGEGQGDTNSVDNFNRELCVVCEVGVINELAHEKKAVVSRSWFWDMAIWSRANDLICAVSGFFEQL